MIIGRDLICITAEEAEFLTMAVRKDYVEKFQQESLIWRLKEAVSIIRSDRHTRQSLLKSKP